MTYAGSLVTSGQGVALSLIAGATETGRISQLMEQSTNLETPNTQDSQIQQNIALCHPGASDADVRGQSGTGESWVEV